MVTKWGFILLRMLLMGAAILDYDIKQRKDTTSIETALQCVLR